MSKKYQQSKDELRSHVLDQLGFITRSSAAYDGGDVSEAKRLALALRLLLHNTKMSRALVGQLAPLHELRFLDTCGELNPENMMTECPMVLIEMRHMVSTTYLPALGEAPFKPSRKVFARWWGDPVLAHAPSSVSFCRRELVLSVANQDGGGHVDPELDGKYARLSRLSEFSMVETRGSYSGPVRPIELAHIRQIAYEVLVSITQGGIGDRMGLKAG